MNASDGSSHSCSDIIIIEVSVMKKLLIAMLVIIALVAAAGFAAAFFIKEPAEALKAKVVANASEKIGRGVSAGDFGGNPFTGFFVRDIKISGRAADLPDTMRLEKIRLSLSFSALLKRQIVIKEISLLNPVIYLERFADGQSSIVDITDRISSAAKEGVDGKEKVESKFSVSMGTISVKEGKLSVKVHGENEEEKEYTIDKVNINLTPAGEGKYSAKGSGDFEGMQLKAEGKVETIPSVLANLNWSADEIDLKQTPAALAEYMKSMEKLNLSGQVAPGGTFKYDENGTLIKANLEMKNFAALGQDFGAGKVGAAVNGEEIKLDGSVGKEGSAHVGLTGIIKTIEDKAIGIDIAPSGISVEKALAVIAPDMKKMITGIAGGAFRISGSGEDVDNIVAGGTLSVLGGDVFYPAPAIHGEGSVMTAVAYESISMNIEHKKPVMRISGIKLKGQALEGSGEGRVEYVPSEDAGEEPAPVSFSISADVKSADVAKILEANPQLKDMVSGAFAGSGTFRGTSGDPASYAGNFTVSLNNGKVLNPYDEQASKLPIDANLSNFTFQSLKGTGKISGETLNVSAAALRSKTLDADVSGSVTFEGALIGRAVASVKPEILGTIENLKPIIAQFPRIAEMKKVDTSFDIGGTVYAPEVKWNADDIARKYGKKIVERKADKLLDKALGSDDGNADSVKSKIKNKLKKIF